MGELEVRVKDLEKKNSELDERLSTLQNENNMLRQVHLYLAPFTLYSFICKVMLLFIVRQKHTLLQFSKNFGVG